MTYPSDFIKPHRFLLSPGRCRAGTNNEAGAHGASESLHVAPGHNLRANSSVHRYPSNQRMDWTTEYSLDKATMRCPSAIIDQIAQS